jgi:hypothetical protein
VALRTKSLFLFGFNITESNRSLDFQMALAGPVKLATLRLGTYNLSLLGKEIVRAMKEADPAHNFDVGVDRTIGGGTENRVVISTDHTFMNLLFDTGPRSASSIAPTIGFQAVDYTGATTYTGFSSAGTRLITSREGYNYLSPAYDQKLFGSVNVSASGVKEAIVYSVQQFFQVQFKYITDTEWLAKWQPLLTWLIQQRPIEFTPEISSPDTFYGGTIDSTSIDGRGLGFRATEMLPDFPFLYDTGLLRFRQIVDVPTFV